MLSLVRSWGKRTAALLYAGVFIVLTLSFVGNIFGVGPSDGWFRGFQYDSTLIPQKTAQCKGELSYDGPVMPSDGNRYMKIMESPVCDKDLAPYTSQYGLQARAITYFAPTNDNLIDRYFHSVRLLLAILSAIVLTAIVWRTAKLFGRLVATVLFGLIAISPWIVAYAQNMYWVLPVMLLPFAFSYVFYDQIRASKKVWVFYATLILLFTMKFLNGYEHATTIAISALVPVVFYEIQRGVDIRKLWKQALFVTAASVIAMMAAITIHIADLANYYQSWDKAQQAVVNRATYRGTGGVTAGQQNVVSGFEHTLPAGYALVDKFYNIDSLKDGQAHPLKYAVLSGLNYLLLPALSFPFVIREPLGTLLESILFVVLLGYLAIRHLRSTKNRYAQSLRYSFWLSLAGALSWLLLMPGHAYPHAHLNAIIFYIPLLFVCYIAIGLTAQQLCVRKPAKVHRGRKK